jgi:hypothetical protein
MLRLLAEMEQVLARMQADMPARLGRPDLTTPRGADRKARGGKHEGKLGFPAGAAKVRTFALCSRMRGHDTRAIQA